MHTQKKTYTNTKTFISCEHTNKHKHKQKDINTPLHINTQRNKLTHQQTQILTHRQIQANPHTFNTYTNKHSNTDLQTHIQKQKKTPTKAHIHTNTNKQTHFKNTHDKMHGL